jgi:hypothetical protein
MNNRQNNSLSDEVKRVSFIISTLSPYTNGLQYFLN